MSHVKTAYGPISTPDWPDDLIVRALRLFGEWSLAEQMLLAPLVRPQDHVWDVGAFLGTFGIGLTQLAASPPRRLLAVEPNRELLPHLKRNLTVNAPCTFEVAAYAAGGSDELFSRRVEADDHNAGSIGYRLSSDGADCVPGRTLRELRRQFGHYDVLKLDIEGMERDAVVSDYDFLEARQPVIWAECNETIESISLLEALVSLKFEPLYVAFPAFRAKNFNGSSEKIYPMAYEAALLAAPAERLVHFTGKVKGEEIIVRPVKTSFDLRLALWSTPRWADSGWTKLSRAELIGWLGHSQTYPDLNSFLNPS